MEKFQKIDLEKFKEMRENLNRQRYNENYRTHIYKYLVGVIVLAITIFGLTILKIWWDYQQYIKEGNDKKRIKEDDLLEMERLKALEDKYKSGEVPNFYKWSQTHDELEIKIVVDHMLKQLQSQSQKVIDSSVIKSKDVKCVFKRNAIKLSILGEDVLNGTFYDDINPVESSWQFGLEVINIKPINELDEKVNNAESNTSDNINSISRKESLNTIEGDTEDDEENEDGVLVKSPKPKSIAVAVRTIEISIRKKDDDDDDENNDDQSEHKHTRRRKTQLLNPLWEYILKEYDGQNAPHVIESLSNNNVQTISSKERRLR